MRVIKTHQFWIAFVLIGSLHSATAAPVLNYRPTDQPKMKTWKKACMISLIAAAAGIWSGNKYVKPRVLQHFGGWDGMADRILLKENLPFYSSDAQWSRLQNATSLLATGPRLNYASSVEASLALKVIADPKAQKKNREEAFKAFVAIGKASPEDQERFRAIIGKIINTEGDETFRGFVLTEALQGSDVYHGIGANDLKKKMTSNILENPKTPSSIRKIVFHWMLNLDTQSPFKEPDVRSLQGTRGWFIGDLPISSKTISAILKSEKDPEVRLLAARMAYYVKSIDLDLIQTLEQLFDDPSVQTRKVALESVGNHIAKVSSDEAEALIPKLKEILKNDPSRNVKYFAWSAWVSILNDFPERVRKKYESDEIESLSYANSFLDQSVGSEELRSKEMIYNNFWRINHPQVVDLLKDQLSKETDPGVRTRILRFLHIKISDDLPYFQELSKTEKALEPSFIILSIRSSKKDPKALEEAFALAEKAARTWKDLPDVGQTQLDDIVKNYAWEAVTPFLFKRLNEQVSVDDRVDALNMIEKLGGTKAIPIFQKMKEISTDEVVRQEAEKKYRYWKEIDEKVQKILKDTH